MKVCIKCKEEKNPTEFGKHKKRKDGLNIYCKSCIKEICKEYYQANKEYYKEYNQANKERLKEYNKKHYQDNKEYHKKYKKEYREANKEKIKEYLKEYYQANKEYHKEYQKANKEKIKEYKKEYQTHRMQTDPLFKMRRYLRTRTWAAFKNKGYSKNTKTQELLGVDWEVAKQHIEKQFTKGMNWDNYGEWHIDHIIPLASAKNEQEMCNLCHYTNLQPLWAEDNIRKSDKII